MVTVTSQRRVVKDSGIDPSTANSDHFTPLPKNSEYRSPGNFPRGSMSSLAMRVNLAVLEAADMVGRDGKGKDKMVGYLAWLARNEPQVFGRMLVKMMPTQLEVRDTSTPLSPSEAADRLRERGIPVPPVLLELEAQRIGERDVGRRSAVDDDECDEL